MTSLQQFAFNAQAVRVISINNEPWFIAQDVCSILTIANVGDALNRLDEDEKDELKGESLIGLTDDPNTVRLAVISESGLYSLTLGSRKPQAKPFKRWVTHEVLPAIRKTGKYEIAPQLPQLAIAPALPQDYEEAVVELLGQIREKKVLAAANQQLEQEKKALQLAIAKDAPKVELFNVYVSSNGWLTGEQIAKQFSVSTRKMFDLLRAEKTIFRKSGRNIPSAKWVSEGWATMRPVKCHDSVVRSSLVFSHKALEQIFDLLRFNKLIPANSDYQTHLNFDEPNQMKRA